MLNLCVDEMLTASPCSIVKETPSRSMEVGGRGLAPYGADVHNAPLRRRELAGFERAETHADAIVVPPRHRSRPSEVGGLAAASG